MGYPPDTIDSDYFDSGIGPDFADLLVLHEPLQLKSGAEELMAFIVPNGCPNISEDMETLIMETLNDRDQDGPLITMNSIELSRDDIQCLVGHSWLNDNKVSNCNSRIDHLKL